jgi:hypothetical protein
MTIEAHFPKHPAFHAFVISLTAISIDRTKPGRFQDDPANIQARLHLLERVPGGAERDRGLAWRRNVPVPMPRCL